MNKYEGYVSNMKNLVVNKLERFPNGKIQSETSGDNVEKHLGTTDAQSENKARKFFKEFTGGKTHSIDIEKDVKND